jgi:acetate kinase
MNIKEILKKQRLFRKVTGKSLILLEKDAKVLDFEPGEQIISSGLEGRCFGIVLKGQLEVLDEEGNRIARINEGEFMGEMSLLTGEPSTADVQAVVASRVLLIHHMVMSQILPQNPDMIKQLASTMRLRLIRREDEDKDTRRPGRGNLPSPENLLSGPGASEMKILVINCGSSSLKWNLYDTSSSERVTGGIIERIGTEGTRHIIQTGLQKSDQIEKQLPDADHSDAFQDILDFLTGDQGPINSLDEIKAIGHRVVHGGEKYTSPVVVNNDVIETIKKLSVLAPLHNPVNLLGIETAQKALPQVPQVAVFDTAFHQSMPPYAYLYGLPYKYYKDLGVRRYGFHGTSHHYVALQAAAYLKRPLNELKIVSCHLGNGSSICAIDHGRSIDTSMGLTPLEGVVMGSRSGDVDAGILFYLARLYNLNVEDMDKLLNRQSGLLGLSGVSNDMREISGAASHGDQQALKAIQVFCYRIKKYIGAYVAALDGLDVLIFTGGIGLGAAGVRARVCQGLDRLGIVLDVIKNRSIAKPATPEEISDPSSKVKMLVIPTDEEKMIARETMRALRQNEVAQIIALPENVQRQIPIFVDERHVHLCEKDVEILFGKCYTLAEAKKAPRSPRLIYKERISLVGPKGVVEDVKIYAPMKSESQVEIGRTEEFLLGIDAPIRIPGDIEGTPGITLEGPKGRVTLEKGVIDAQHRVQMDPEHALAFGLRDGDRVIFALEGANAPVFGDVLIRVRPNLRLGMNLNADEAKAAEITEGMMGRIIGVVGIME